MRRAVVAILVLFACSVSPASADLGMTTMITALSTDPIADEIFSLPAGYTKK